MCGRYTLTASPAAVAEHFDLAGPLVGVEPVGAEPDGAPGTTGVSSSAIPAPSEPRYNVAPGQRVPVVRVHEGPRVLELRRWGLVPHWAENPAIGGRLVNARCETAAEKPAFRDAFRRRRCLVPADGFYEWAAHAGRKLPHHIHREDGALFAFAGLYARWRPQGGDEATVLETCTVLTTAANDRVRPLHDRMPVILDPEHYTAWLDPELHDPAEVARLLDAAVRDSRGLASLVHRPVGLRVNDVGHDDPACLADPEPPAQVELFQ